MATGAIVFRWGSPVRGREQQGLGVFAESTQYYEGLQKEGRIEDSSVWLSMTGRGGMLVVEGEVEELQRLQNDDEFMRLALKAGAIVDDFTIDLCRGGSDQAVQESIARYTAAASELGIL